MINALRSISGKPDPKGNAPLSEVSRLQTTMPVGLRLHNPIFFSRCRQRPRLWPDAIYTHYNTKLCYIPLPKRVPQASYKQKILKGLSGLNRIYKLFLNFIKDDNAQQGDKKCYPGTIAQATPAKAALA